MTDPINPIQPADDEHVLDATGHIHVTDAPIDLSVYSFEAWIALSFFWILAATVCHQFFTRYFLNDSASRTMQFPGLQTRRA